MRGSPLALPLPIANKVDPYPTQEHLSRKIHPKLTQNPLSLKTSILSKKFISSLFLSTFHLLPPFSSHILLFFTTHGLIFTTTGHCRHCCRCRRCRRRHLQTKSNHRPTPSIHSTTFNKPFLHPIHHHHLLFFNKPPIWRREMGLLNQVVGKNCTEQEEEHVLKQFQNKERLMMATATMATAAGASALLYYMLQS